MRPSYLSMNLVSFLFLAAAGCGGKVTFELGSGGAGGTASVGNTSGKTSTSGTSVTHAAGTSVTSTSDVGTSNVGTSNVGTSVVSGSSSTGIVVGPPVACNGGSCNPGEICCFNPNGPGDHCGQVGQCDMGFVELDCSTPANCPGGVCCGTFNPNTQQYEGISCQATCDGQNDITICTNMPPSPCPQGTQCHKSMQLGNGYRVCF